MLAEDKKLMLEIWRDSRTVVDWVNGHSTLKRKESTIASAQNLLREWWGEVWIYDTVWPIGATHTFREHNKEADSWLGQASKVVKKNGWTLRTSLQRTRTRTVLRGQGKKRKLRRERKGS